MAGLWGTYAKFSGDKTVQIRADRLRAYTQLKGQQAELLKIGQLLLLANDKGFFYQVQVAQGMANTALGRKAFPPTALGKLLEKLPNERALYTSEAVTEERNSEHYNDELIDCDKRMFESIGMIQLSFPQNAILDERIASVEAMLTNTEDILPHETPLDRLLSVMRGTADPEQWIGDQMKEQMPYIQRAMEPLTDLLNYLQTQINTDPR